MAYLPHINDPSVLCDSTVFSDPASDSISALHSSRVSDASGTSNMPKESSKSAQEAQDVFPILPQPHNFSALGNPVKFQCYIAVELPLALNKEGDGLPMPSPLPPLPTNKLRRKDVNSTFLNSLLSKASRIRGTAEWVERDVFPDFKLPTLFNEGAVRSCPKLWNSKSLTYPRPPVDMTEPKVREWLNNIAQNLAVVHKIADGTLDRSDRGFDSRTAAKGPSGGFMLRRPDICVIDRETQHDATKTQEERLHWRRIYCIIEVTSKKSPLRDLLCQISQKAACIFDVQPQRVFVCALAIFGEPTKLEFVFVLVDRAGMTHTQPTQINSYAVFTFLRIVFAFCFAKPETIGWDPSMTIDPETYEVTSITVTASENDKPTPNITTRTFDVVKLIHSSPILYSRGTRVWIVKDQQGHFYVLKDSWILEASAVSEIQLIKHVEETVKQDPDGYLFQSNCPSYVIGQDCVCSTDTIRGLLSDKPAARHRRRIVTATIGDPITSFRSKKEFVSVFLDIVNTLEFLSTKAKVIHGDLSINNILINRVWNYEPGCSPSQLRHLSTSKADTAPDVSDLGFYNDSMSQSGSGSNAGDVVQSPDIDISAPVVQGPTPALVVNTSATTVDYGGTSEFIESAGMVIDCDFMRFLGQTTHQTSGTLPFMAIQALMSTSKKPFIHDAGHDLECLLNTILTLCHYTTGPCGQLREIVPNSEKIKLNDWFTTDDRRTLAATKSITLEAFDTFIGPALPDYWRDFTPFLQRLIDVTWNNKPFLQSPNVATHEAYRNILKDALNKYTLEEKTSLGLYASVPVKKRPLNYEGDQVFRNSKRLRQSESGGPSQKRLRPRHPFSQFLESYQESIEPARVDSNIE